MAAAATLAAVVAPAAAGGALAGKRPLESPAALSSAQTRFRGAPNNPGDSIKVPKLSGENRNTRGVNTPVPHSRECPIVDPTAPTGRLAPGDVAFLLRTPVGCAGVCGGYGRGLGNQMHGVFGLDCVNDMLSGSLNSARRWVIGENLVDTKATPFVDGQNLLEFAQENLKVFHDYRLDGIVLSTEKHYEALGEGTRDACLFNIVGAGWASVNNGYHSYDLHAGAEMYPRNRDQLLYNQTANMDVSSRGNTWHDKSGYAGPGGMHAQIREFPHQMFGRELSPGDRLYLLVRAYTIEDVLAGRNGDADAAQRTQTANRIYVENADGSRMMPADIETRAKELMFVQMMPCSSGDFADYQSTLRMVDKALPDPLKELSVAMRLGQYLKLDQIQALRAGREKAFLELRAKNHPKTRYQLNDAVRFLDVLNCLGAWRVGQVIDAKATKAHAHSSAPADTSYRCGVVVDLRWLPRNKQLALDDAAIDKDLPLLLTMEADKEAKKIIDVVDRSHVIGRDAMLERRLKLLSKNAVADRAMRTLAAAELHERPVLIKKEKKKKKTTQDDGSGTATKKTPLKRQNTFLPAPPLAAPAPPAAAAAPTAAPTSAASTAASTAAASTAAAASAAAPKAPSARPKPSAKPAVAAGTTGVVAPSQPSQPSQPPQPPQPPRPPRPPTSAAAPSSSAAATTATTATTAARPVRQRAAAAAQVAPPAHTAHTAHATHASPAATDESVVDSVFSRIFGASSVPASPSRSGDASAAPHVYQRDREKGRDEGPT